MANPGTAESKTSKRFQRFANLFSRATKPASSKAEQEEFYEEDDDFLGSEFGPNSLAQFRSAMSCTEAQVLRSRSQSVLPSPQRISGSNIPNGRSSPAPSKGPLLGGAQALANALARRAQSFSTRQNLSYNPNAPPVQNKSVSVGKSNYGGGVVLPVVSRSGHPDVLASAPQQYFDASLSNSNSPSPMGSQRGMLSPRSPVSRSASSNLNTSRPQPPPPLHVPQMNTFFQDEVTSPVSAMPSPVPPASMRSEKSFKRASAIIVDPMLRSGQDWSPAAAPASPAGPQSSNTMSSPGAVLSASNTGLQRSPSLLDRSASGKVMEQILSPAASQEQPRRRGESRVLGLSPCVPPTMQRPMYLIEDYTLMAKLHASATCSVYKAFCKWSMTIVALKVGPGLYTASQTCACPEELGHSAD